MFASLSPRKLVSAALMITAALALPIAASAQEVTVETARGEATVAANPSVVFSFDYGTIDTLHELGVTVDGAPPLPAAAPGWVPDGALEIGSLFEPDYELINAEQPDLVVIAGRSSAAYDELQRLVPTIDLSNTSDLVTDLKRNVTTLGEIFGLQDEASAALAKLDAKIASVRDTAASVDNGMLLMVTGGSLTAVAADNSRGAVLYDLLGITPTVADVQSATHGDPVSFEFVLQHDPQWLFVIDRDAAIAADGAQPASAVLDNELMHQAQAFQNGRIVYLDPFSWYIVSGSGLGTANAMLDEVATALTAQ